MDNDTHQQDPVATGITGDITALEAALDLGARPRAVPPAADVSALALEAYRRFGHLAARLDPLGRDDAVAVTDFEPRLAAPARAPDVWIAHLHAAYCGAIGWEFAHIADAEVRAFFATAAETADASLPAVEARAALMTLARAEAFETALSRRIPGGKLFGLGGAETLILLLETLLTESVGAGVREVVIGGMHRGRFNLLANVAGKPLGDLVAEVLGKPSIPDGLGLSSDVSYHLGYSGDRDIGGHVVHFSVSPHPSHLQIVQPITQGRVRAKQAAIGEGGRRRIMPLMLHTDASFSGQGLVAEMLQLSGLPPYDIGGSVHVVVDNQLGFTTDPRDGRTARRSTDIARLIEAPVLHVNGDDPEAVVRIARVAAEFRARFGRDILLRLVCYRRPGHNEIDEPRFTQPLMYSRIDARPPVTALYAATLAERGIDAGGLVSTISADIDVRMGEAFAAAKAYQTNRADWFDGAWHGLRAGSFHDMSAHVATGVDLDRLRHLGRRLTDLPEDFEPDPRVRRFLDERRASIEEGQRINWATAEALALASLVADGVPVRLSGQDSVRGAFTQRHLDVHDQKSGRRHSTIAAVAPRPDMVEIHNTPLIEHAVLCHEYGLSLADPRRLVIWEAQFGEFLNIAQPVFDQAIACGEDRWLRSSGLVMLLPHGLDGGGPDHSTARPERLLAAAAGANIAIANPSTPANYFHLLRRQMARDFRKPLVVTTPKWLLRHKACVSALDAFGPGSGFLPCISDPAVARARRIVLCAGKIYYELVAARSARGLDGEIAIIRIEQLHPLPADDIAAAIAQRATDDIVWCEEEPANMGWFTHLDRALEKVTGRPLRRVGRPASPTPASGVKSWHERELAAVVEAALG